MEATPLETQNETGTADIVRQGRKFFSKLGLMYFLGTLIIMAAQYATAVIVKWVAPELLRDPNISLLLGLQPLYLIGMPLLIVLVRTVPAQKVEKHTMSIGKLLLACIMCYAIMYCSNLVGTVITFVIGLFKGSMVNNAIQDIAMSINPIVSIVFMVICAPIMEELIFRKLLVDRAVRYGEGVAVVLSGVMFGLFHGNLSQFAYAFTIGMFFAFIYVKTGKIHYTIIIHMLLNFMGGVMGPLIMKLIDYDALNKMTMLQDEAAIMEAVAGVLPGLLVLMLYMLLILAIVITGIVLLIVFRKKFSLCAGNITIPRGKRFATVIWNVGMVLFSLFWIVQIILQLFE